jgi:hypothetical protein
MDTFEPQDTPVPAFDPAEATLLAPQFAELGVNDAHTAISNWIGKPNRFTGLVMTHPYNVLTYFQQELEARKNSAAQSSVAVAEQQREDKTGPDRGQHAVPTKNGGTGVVKAKPDAALRAQAEQAGEAWRNAVKQRAAAMQQWDQYVRSLSDAYKAARAAAGLR